MIKIVGSSRKKVNKKSDVKDKNKKKLVHSNRKNKKKQSLKTLSKPNKKSSKKNTKKNLKGKINLEKKKTKQKVTKKSKITKRSNVLKSVKSNNQKKSDLIKSKMVKKSNKKRGNKTNKANKKSNLLKKIKRKVESNKKNNTDVSGLDHSNLEEDEENNKIVNKDVNVDSNNIFDDKVDLLSKKKLDQFAEKINDIKSEVSKLVVGQKELLKFTIIALMCDGNALLEGVPGLAKSLLVETISRTISNATFKRIQFVPDMLPADIIGVNAYNPKTGQFYIVKGPIFTNFLLADEINRAPPKTQAAMMEAMQERKVNIHNTEFKFARPFLVLATQNPLEQYGTYPLPEAVVDRFFLKIILDYPTKEEELKIIDQNTLTTFNALKVVKPVITPNEIIEIQDAVRKVYISKEVKEYLVNIVNTSRGRGEPIKGQKYIKYGASPRATIWLSLGARAVAIMNGRDYVVPDDVREIIHPVLRHRLILNYEGKAVGVSTDDIIDSIIEAVEVP